MIVGLSLTRASLPPLRRVGKLRRVRNSDAERPRAAVDGVVLAAGRSSRMGTPKTALELDGATFVQRVVRALREGGCRDVVAVVGADDSRAGPEAAAAGARVVMNTARDSEQIDSLRLALRNLMPGAEGIVVLPVDHPRVSAASVEAVIHGWTGTRRPIARASYGGTAGHPTLFAASVFDELLRGELPEGARSVIAAHAAEVLDVPVTDPGVTTDIDTPDDYRRAGGERP